MVKDVVFFRKKSIQKTNTHHDEHIYTYYIIGIIKVDIE